MSFSNSSVESNELANDNFRQLSISAENTSSSSAQSYSQEARARTRSNANIPEVITISTQPSPEQVNTQQFSTPVLSSQGFDTHIVINSSPSQTSGNSTESIYTINEALESHAAEPPQPDQGSPSRKHPLPTNTHKECSSNKRIKIDHEADTAPLGGKLGVATLLNPEPEDDDKAGRSRVLFKCAVCLDMPDPAVFVHPCGHVFCELCAQGAVQTTMRCPVCRHSMRMRDIRVLQFKVAKVGR
ncbi:hypothetical protein LPJ78_000852 [Coemansia sp. RSA 989]|nr:hypothetical protein BX667DRAFT_493820 [Coemansia mojavensis]KAJ1743527.1 hypothetical protein LPJ68_000905 [Coemansia sp. RSA 1086]KAJ1753814.1 hypothetical protein LPJ79_000101 [Coemansia sp. RSA 1821]KAJ1867617.1 hypothetical protein LPJ78_000852 [Coemansia sp. RSA 989]KAJ2676913.1 hypothetical protein IWW42_000251 [Coemansia sp. RSA 1085]